MQSRLCNFHFFDIFFAKNLVNSKKSSTFTPEKYLTYSRLDLIHNYKSDTKIILIF